MLPIQSIGVSLNRLMAQHDGLVQVVVRQQVLGELSFTEAFQAGRIDLWRAITLTGSVQVWALTTREVCLPLILSAGVYCFETPLHPRWGAALDRRKTESYFLLLARNRQIPSLDRRIWRSSLSKTAIFGLVSVSYKTGNSFSDDQSSHPRNDSAVIVSKLEKSMTSADKQSCDRLGYGG